MFIRNARIITFDRHNRILDCGAAEVCPDGSLGWIGSEKDLPIPSVGTEVLDAGGKLLMPALINCHTHLYSSLSRGIRLLGSPPRNFTEILKKLWWKLDSALNEEDVYLSAMVGLVDSAKAGIATVFDHHSSPAACSGSLDIIENALAQVGLRGCLCYETSDRNGRAKAQEAIRENERFIKRVGDLEQKHTIGAAFGLHASFTLSDRTLQQCIEVNKNRAGFHIHVAEDKSDVAYSRSHFHKSPVRRLADLRVLDDKTVAAHCVHVSAGDMEILARRGVNVVHNPQSNSNNAVGTADLTQLLRHKVNVGLGSDGYSPRMLDEFAAAFHQQKARAGDPRTGYDEAFRALLNSRELARRVCGWKIGAVEAGARADLMLVRYYPPTPLTSDNLFGHLLFGISRSQVDSLWVNGKLIVRDGNCITVDERAISEKAAVSAQKLWSRM